jgi:hypothetical protein
MRSGQIAGATGALLVLLQLAGTAAAGPTLGGTDRDLDGVEDAFDNCVAVVNPGQADFDHNGCGDACTQNIRCDINGDTAVGLPDFLIFAPTFNMTVLIGTGGDCGVVDGAVGLEDFLALGSNWGHRVGPSGITNAACDPSRCQCTPQ